jgi:hypothetical protein
MCNHSHTIPYLTEPHTRSVTLYFFYKIKISLFVYFVNIKVLFIFILYYEEKEKENRTSLLYGCFSPSLPSLTCTIRLQRKEKKRKEMFLVAI